MGWATGSAILSDIVDSLKTHLDDVEIRQAVYVELIQLFEAYDCDTMDEVEDVEFAKLVKEHYADIDDGYSDDD